MNDNHCDTRTQIRYFGSINHRIHTITDLLLLLYATDLSPDTATVPSERFLHWFWCVCLKMRFHFDSYHSSNYNTHAAPQWFRFSHKAERAIEASNALTQERNWVETERKFKNRRFRVRFKFKIFADFLVCLSEIWFQCFHSVNCENVQCLWCQLIETWKIIESRTKWIIANFSSKDISFSIICPISRLKHNVRCKTSELTKGTQTKDKRHSTHRTNRFYSIAVAVLCVIVWIVYFYVL